MTPLAVRIIIVAFILGALWPANLARADQPTALRRIGVLLPPEAQFPLGEGLREGLRDLGYVEGKTVSFDWRPPGKSEAEMRAVANDFVRSRVDLVVAFTTPAARAVLDATKLPLVFMAGDPVTAGLARSLAKPGGRATGVSILAVDLTAKRLEFLHLAAPRARRIAHLVNLANPNNELQVDAARQAAPALGLEVVTLDVQKGLDAALEQISATGADAVLVGAELFFLVNRANIARALLDMRLPAIFPATEYHEGGILMSYGPNLKQVTRRVAAFADKILKGADPRDLPVEQVSQYELVINQRMARTLGLQLSQDLLMRADEVIR